MSDDWQIADGFTTERGDPRDRVANQSAGVSAPSAGLTRLVRSQSGETIHLRGCVRAGVTHDWRWAEGRDDSEWLSIPWLRACKTCFPEAQA